MLTGFGPALWILCHGIMSGSAQRTGLAHLPLHGGRAPAWLFQRMARLAREITAAIVVDHGPQEMLRRLADPFWFQAFGCVLGYDWHSSGLTTTVCGALKAGLDRTEHDLGLFVAGGKGRTARSTPSDIEARGASLAVNPSTLIHASRMSAKVDSVALQDGYDLYHHTMFFTKSGSWTVVQQGMNTQSRYARRYHWLGDSVTDFCCEPQAAICCDSRGKAFNLVASESQRARDAITDMTHHFKPGTLKHEFERVRVLAMPRREYIAASDVNVSRIGRFLDGVQETPVQDFASLLALPGMGRRTTMAMALIADIVYGAPTSFRDPATYSFAHGGKDGYPYPVDRTLYDTSIRLLAGAVRRANISGREKGDVLSRLRPRE